MNRYFGNILVIDNDALTYLFKYTYDENPKTIERVLSFLRQTYDAIWIPQEVLNEFLIKRNDQKRLKRINKIKALYDFIEDCPINVTLAEIRILIGHKDSDMGEADALLQIQKVLNHNEYKVKTLTFFSNDSGAMKLAKGLSIQVYPYEKLKNTFRESGVIIY